MITFNYEIDDKNNRSIVFKAVENEVILGSCKLMLEENYADVTEVSYSQNSKFIVEGLLKAAFNFSANRNYYMGRCSAKNIDFCLERMNLVKSDSYFENDIPSILMGSCGGCCK